MKQFVTALDQNGQCFQYVSQIKRLIKDSIHFETIASETEQLKILASQSYHIFLEIVNLKIIFTYL